MATAFARTELFYFFAKLKTGSRKIRSKVTIAGYLNTRALRKGLIIFLSGAFTKN